MECSNPMCAEYRIQHRNVTIQKLEAEKELQQLRRMQASELSSAVAQRNVTPIRDPVTGMNGLIVRGEMMTADKIMLKMDMATKYQETLHSIEKINAKLSEDNSALRRANDAAQAEIRRLEQVLGRFEKTRRHDTFTAEAHKATLELNHQLADQIERLERENHVLTEENEVLLRSQQRIEAVHSRHEEDGDDESIASFITADGRVPSECPCNPQTCAERYQAQVLMNDTDVAAAFEAHMLQYHRCMHCRRLVKGVKTVHEQACELKGMAKIPKKKKRKALQDDENDT